VLCVEAITACPRGLRHERINAGSDAIALARAPGAGFPYFNICRTCEHDILANSTSENRVRLIALCPAQRPQVIAAMEVAIRRPLQQLLHAIDEVFFSRAK